MDNKITRSEALELFHKIDESMDFKKPRTAARRTFSIIFDSMEDGYVEVVEEVKVLTCDKEISDG